MSHDILLRELEAYGIKKNVIRLTKNYLSDRKQCVQNSDKKSDVKGVLHRVLHGSILGPPFYIIYANDFSSASELVFTIMFADDTSVFIEGQSCGNVCQLLNKEQEKCDIWIKTNKLTLILKKIHFMIFHRSRIKSEGVQITIRIENIKETKSIIFFKNHCRQ